MFGNKNWHTAQRGGQRVMYKVREAGASLRPPSLDHINVTSGVPSPATRSVPVMPVMIAIVMVVIVDVMLVNGHTSGRCAADQLAHG